MAEIADLARMDHLATLAVQLDLSTDEGARSPAAQQTLVDHWRSHGVPFLNSVVLDLLAGPGLTANAMVAAGASLVVCVDDNPEVVRHLVARRSRRIRVLNVRLPTLPPTPAVDVATLAFEGINLLGEAACEQVFAILADRSTAVVCGDLRLADSAPAAGIARCQRRESRLYDGPHVEIRTWQASTDDWVTKTRIEPTNGTASLEFTSRIWLPSAHRVKNLFSEVGYSLRWVGEPLRHLPTDVPECARNASFVAMFG